MPNGYGHSLPIARCDNAMIAIGVGALLLMTVAAIGFTIRIWRSRRSDRIDLFVSLLVLVSVLGCLALTAFLVVSSCGR